MRAVARQQLSGALSALILADAFKGSGDNQRVEGHGAKELMWTFLAKNAEVGNSCFKFISLLRMPVMEQN